MDLRYTLAYQGKDSELATGISSKANEVGAGINSIATTQAKPTALRSSLSKALDRRTTPAKVFMVRDLSLTGESKQDAFARDAELISRDNGRQLALVYLTDSKTTLGSQAKSGKIREARFINPETVSDVVTLGRNRTQDIADLFERFDTFFRHGEGTPDHAETRQFGFAAPESRVDALLKDYGQGDSAGEHRDHIGRHEW